MKRSSLIPRTLAVLALACSFGLPARADDSVTDSFKKMGKAIGEAGKEVGKSAGKAGKTLGRESEKVWYKGVQVSKPALEKARWETRRAIEKSLDAMDRSIESLKRELQSLKEQDRSGGGG